MTELAKTFEPGPIEARWYARWEESGAFRPERLDATPFTIVMPPPNVTGSLHIGHALDVTLQDILIRHARMQGKDSLWVVGTDHAGIATQMVVERQLADRQDKRTNYSREDFIAKVWEWKAESGGEITQQLRRLGASCDWANERFTMDPGFSAAVTKVFVDLYNKGLLYRDKRLVNWDPKFHTAISDLEVEMRETDGHMWHFRYPLEDGSGYIAIATTRPETILGDGAVAVHPDDERYRHLVGKLCRLPIVERLIPIIADGHVEMDFGSGAVKITAAHDFNDFEVYKRHPDAGIPLINLMTADARMNENTPPEFQGLDRYEARKLVVEKFEALGLLDKIEPHKHNMPYGDRSGVVIEPWLTDQWYVDAKTLAGPAIAAVKSGAIKIVPETWVKTWFNWLENIQPWCVSRQLWWGHRIPAWYGPDLNNGHAVYDLGGVVSPKSYVGENEDEISSQLLGIFAEHGYDRVEFLPSYREVQLRRVELAGTDEADRIITVARDVDVLDTWFSSALWPFATLGWPEQTEDFVRHYPNDVLISGFDILFFWDARMAMQGIEFMKEVPWKTLYLHGLVRDAAGQKMSKSKGNTVDPLGLIDRFGADALRFTLTAMESQGRDIKLDEKRVEGYRNFATKLWNAARFLQGNGVGASQSIAAPPAELAVNRWIIGEVVETLAKLNKAIADLRYDEMADAIYHFTWGTFCDWYVELVKGAWDDETRAVAAWAFDQILVMLHPFMPFVTEELWHSMGQRPYELIVAKWPAPGAKCDATAGAEIGWLVDFVSEARAMRTELNVPWSVTLDPIVVGGDSRAIERLAVHAPTLARMAKLGPASASETVPEGSAQIVVGGVTYAFHLAGAIDLDAERSRLSKGVAAAEKDRDSLAARLGNPAFSERAKPEAVDKARADHEARAAEAERLSAALARLG